MHPIRIDTVWNGQAFVPARFVTPKFVLRFLDGLKFPVTAETRREAVRIGEGLARDSGWPSCHVTTSWRINPFENLVQKITHISATEPGTGFLFE